MNDESRHPLIGKTVAYSRRADPSRLYRVDCLDYRDGLFRFKALENELNRGDWINVQDIVVIYELEPST